MSMTLMERATDARPEPSQRAAISERLLVIALNESLALDYFDCHATPGARAGACVLATRKGGDPAGAESINPSVGRLAFDRLAELQDQKFSDEDVARHRNAPWRIVLFARSSLDRETRAAFEQMRRLIGAGCVASVTLVHSCGGVLGDRAALVLEEGFREATAGAGCRVRIVRCGVILSPRSAATRWGQRLSWLHPLLGERPATPFVPADMLFAAIDDVSDDRRGSWTLLGPRRSWKEWLSQLPPGPGQRGLAGVAQVLSWLMLGALLRVCLALARRLSSRLRVLDFHELRPTTMADLVSLCNRWTYPHVQIAGYNNGVNHFGWRFPGRTIVITTESGRLIRSRGDRLTVDAGTTLKRCLDALGREGRDLIVAPNFSYVAVGTSFFVPIHGSGCDVSTLGDTIERVLLYDPRTERFVRAKRGEPAFSEAMYNRAEPLLLLRLTLRTRESVGYEVSKETLAGPTADELIAILTDRSASNVEIRKHRATDDAVDVTRYAAVASATADGSIEAPRDRIGRVWDRLEENPLAAVLFHTFVRRFAYHVELFMTPDEFRTFWEAHRRLPLSKIQLRCVRKDGMRHSPMRSDDLISADLFLMRRRRAPFLEFVRTSLPGVRFNPGKQSL